MSLLWEFGSGLELKNRLFWGFGRLCGFGVHQDFAVGIQGLTALKHVEWYNAVWVHREPTDA